MEHEEEESWHYLIGYDVQPHLPSRMYDRNNSAGGTVMRKP